MKTNPNNMKPGRLSTAGILQMPTLRPAAASGIGTVFLRALCLVLVTCLWAFSPAQAQSNITQNNLIQNGGLDAGGADWGFSGGGAYWYPTGGNGEPTGLSYVSIGWWNGCNIYQNTGATFQPGIDYVLTMRAAVGSSPMTGVTLGLGDVTQGWTSITNASLTFPDQTGTMQVFSLYISSNTVAANVGDTIAASGGILENPGGQYGWLNIDWLQLAPALPYFTSNLVGATNYTGAASSLSVAAIGAVTNSIGAGSVLLYQWYQNGKLLPNATNSTLAIAALNTTNAGNYYVVATSPYGSSQSSTGMLAVLPANPPIVSAPPASQSAYVFQTVQFTVGVAGTPPFQYQWFANSSAISGATNSVLTLNDISATSTGTYTVAISNQFGHASSAASLSVITPVAGTYEASAIALEPDVYLRFSDINDTNEVINEGTLGAVADATAEGNYVATTGPLPPDFPNLESTNPAVQFDGASADVAIPPLNFSTNTGNTATLSAWVYCYGSEVGYAGVVFERGGDASGMQIQTDANGDNILSYDWATGGRWQFQSGLIIPPYQWCFVALVVTPTNGTLYLQDGTSMQTAVDTYAEGISQFTGNTYVGWDPNGGAGATSRRFNGIIDEVTIFNRSLSAADVGSLYYAATGEPAGIVTSPAGLTNYTGQPFSLSVVASGAPPLSYQWYKNSHAIAGATNDTYTVAAATTNDSGSYEVYVANTGGNTNSANATVLIETMAPFFSALPESVDLWNGVASTISAQADGSGPLSYQWYLNGAPVAGQTNASLNLSDPEAANGGSYVFRVSNAYGTTNSAAVLVTVSDPSQSEQMLYSTNTTATWNLRNNYQPIQGVWFQTGTKARLVTHLGYFDSTGTGLLTNHWLGIYQGPPGSGTLLASVQVLAGTSNLYSGGFRWAPLSTPFILEANTNYVLAASDNNWDLWPDAFEPTWNTAYVGDTSGNTRYPMYDSSLVAWPHEPNTPINTWGLNLTYGIFNLGNFPLTLTGSGSSAQLTWSLGTLMSSPSAAGPYQPVANATSPYTLPLTGPAQFYRLQY